MKLNLRVTLGLIAVGAVAFVLAPFLSAFAVPIYAPASKAILGVTFNKLGVLGALPLAMGRTEPVDQPAGGGMTLVSKNRKAQELRAEASKLRAEIADVSKVMTLDELKTKQEAINALEARANAVAEFTADDEVRRQGGDGGLERLDGPESDPKTRRREQKRGAMAAKIAEYTERVQDAFGDVRSFLKVAVANGGNVDQATPAQRKLIEENKTLVRAIVGTAGDVSGGEFLLPLTQVQSIFSLANVQEGLLQRARTYNVPGRTLRIPYLIQTDEGASTTLNRPMAGQIANVSIVGEGATKPARTPQFGQRLLTVYKYAAITQASDEILGDDFTGELPQEFINAVGQQALNKVNEDVTIDGSGTAEPYGALKASQAWNISASRESAGTIKPSDLFEMYAKHTHGPNSFWLASRYTVQALFNLSLTSASLVTFLKDLTGKPEMRILGYPVILTDLLPTLGTGGDLCLVNPDFYALALRQALTVESSRDFAFTQDLTTYRFIVRAGGITINTGKYAYKYDVSNSIDEHAPFVYLAT